MSDDSLDGQLLHELCEEAHTLARKMTGTMRRLTVQAGDYRVEVEWDPAPVATAPAAAAAASGTPATAAAEPAPAEADTGHAITAPLVGTFYAAPEPGAKPFVEEGGHVEAGQDVAIVEAMKIMNRVTSDVTGTVRKILVADGEMVEFGQRLMIVDVEPG